MIPYVRRVHFTLRDNAANLPGDYVADMEATKLTRPHWFRSFILGEWGAFEGQAYPEFADAIHVVEPFECRRGGSGSNQWITVRRTRRRGMRGPRTTTGTWSCSVSTTRRVELVSHHAREVLRLRGRWHPAGVRVHLLFGSVDGREDRAGERSGGSRRRC